MPLLAVWTDLSTNGDEIAFPRKQFDRHTHILLNNLSAAAIKKDIIPHK
jgi:hypothetical protein